MDKVTWGMLSSARPLLCFREQGACRDTTGRGPSQGSVPMCAWRAAGPLLVGLLMQGIAQTSVALTPRVIG